MNIVRLNTVSLDGIIKKGGGTPINNQEKSLEITENGTTVVKPDAEFTGLSKVGVTVAIPNEEKTVEITKNGTTEVTADSGFLNKVVVNTNVVPEGTVVSKDVNFYDYDGTLLYSYDWNEVLELSELPPLPTQEGLICQEWNYTLDEIKNQSHHMADVGATYTTDDSATRLYLNIDTEEIPELILNVRLIEGDELVFDWGDGITESLLPERGGTQKIYHQYKSKGKYVIKIHSLKGFALYGTDTNKNCLSYSNTLVPKWLRRVEIAHFAEQTKSLGYVFGGCTKLEYITICKGDWKDGLNYVCSECTSLKALILPKGTKCSTQSAPCFYDYGLKVVSAPNGSEIGNTRYIQARRIVFPEGAVGYYSWGTNLYHVEELALPQSFYAYSRSDTYPDYNWLKKIILADGIKTIPAYTLAGSYLMTQVEIPDTVTSIEKHAFSGCKNILKLNLPKSLTSIGTYAFLNCGVECLDIPNGVTQIEAGTFNSTFTKVVNFKNHLLVPTLANSNAFDTTHTKIVVPVALYDEWASSTNWSSLADAIVRDYTPQECTSLQITADDVIGNRTSTTIHWVATTNGVDSFGTHYEGIVLKGEVISDTFPQNTSESETIARDIEFTYLGVSATTQITHKEFVNWRIECLYNIESTGTKAIAHSSYWSNLRSYLDKMYVDGEEVAIPNNSNYVFNTVGEHSVVFDFNNDKKVDNLYYTFSGVSSLVEVNVILDLEHLKDNTSSSGGIGYMFNGCSNLRSVTLCENIMSIQGRAFYGCRNLASLTILAKNAPKITSDYTFGYYSETAGYDSKANGANILYVTKGAAGYDGTYWTQYLLNPSYGGFSIVEIEEQ